MTRKSIKKSISLREDVFETANEMADIYFGGNFSAYLTYLICADKHGLSRVRMTGEETERDEEIRKAFTKSEESDTYIDSILGIGDD